MLRKALMFMTLVLEIPMVIAKAALGVLSLIALMAIKGLIWCDCSVGNLLNLGTVQKVKDGYNTILDFISSFKFKSSRKETEA